ncbi:isochorismatase family protein [soil metagenome]
MHRPFRLEIKRTALLIVDLQEEQRGPDYQVAEFDRVLGNVRRLLDAARTRGMKVIHSAFRRDFQATPERPFEPLTEDGRPTFSDPASTLTDICHEVAPAPSETVIYKNDASVFSEGTLQPMLAGAAINWLVVTGVWTEACIAATIRDAIAAGIHALLVKDACGSGTAALHETGVLNIANRLYGGAVADTDATLRLIAGEERDIWISVKPVPILFTYADAAAHYRNL